MANKFEFTVDEINLVLEGLQELAFKRSGGLITRLVNEFNAQNQAAAQATAAIQAAAQDPANVVDAPPANRKARRAAKAR